MEVLYSCAPGAREGERSCKSSGLRAVGEVSHPAGSWYQPALSLKNRLLSLVTWQLDEANNYLGTTDLLKNSFLPLEVWDCRGFVEHLSSALGLVEGGLLKFATSFIFLLWFLCWFEVSGEGVGGSCATSLATPVSCSHELECLLPHLSIEEMFWVAVRQQLLTLWLQSLSLL